MRLRRELMGAALLVAACGCPADRQRELQPGDTAAIHMEQEGAVPDKSLPDGIIDTAAVGPDQDGDTGALISP